MNKDLTELVLVVDRSGSMAGLREETQAGINRLIADQREQEGECRVTLAEFDDIYNLVHNNVNINDVGEYILEPRAMTALHDAIGKTINTVGQRLANTAEHQRPGLVAFNIFTDGHENASREFNGPQIAQMITHQTEAYNWQFTFLGANQDAALVGRGLGISPSASATYNTSPMSVKNMYAGVSSNVTRMRGATRNSETVTSGFTPEEKESMSRPN